jgi:hypothetical protein
MKLNWFRKVRYQLLSLYLSEGGESSAGRQVCPGGQQTCPGGQVTPGDPILPSAKVLTEKSASKNASASTDFFMDFLLVVF